MHIGPIYFISRSTVSPLEHSRHRFVGEAVAVRRSIGNSRRYLWVEEFTVLSDCSGLEKYLNWRLLWPTQNRDQ